MASISVAPQRKDAQRNREAILAAARELLSESADVPMYEIARHAGVGQATLYRNFPDRRNLAAALLEEQMAVTEATAAQHAGNEDAIFVLLRRITEHMAGFYALGQLAREDACLGSALERHRQRLVELMEEPLRNAKAAGALRHDVSVEDVFLIISAIRGAMDGVAGPAPRATAGGRLLTLLVDGLTPAQPAG